MNDPMSAYTPEELKAERTAVIAQGREVMMGLRGQIDNLVASLIAEKWEKKQVESEVHNLRIIVKYLRSRGIWDYLFGSKE